MRTSLRILAIDTERTWRGGERQALLLALGLQRRGHRVVLAVRPRSPLALRASELGVEVEPLRARGELDPFAARRLAAIARDRGVDLLHAHTAHAHTLALAARRRLRLPLVVSRRVDFPPRRGWFSRWKYRRGADHYIAITEAVARVLERAGVERRRISVVPSGVDLDRLAGADGSAVRRDLGALGDRFLVGAVGHLAWHKGFEILVEAARRSDPDRFLWVVVGEGEERADLERRAARAGVASRFRLLGFRKDVPDLLAAFDVLAAPSHMEGLNTSILDAMALGRPVVASRVGGIPEAVVHGETGLLVPPGDPDALARAVRRLADDPALARRLGEAARRRVREKFSADAMVEGTLEVYRSVLERRSAALG